MGAKESTTEVRVKDPTTGGEKGSKLARYDLLPVLPLRELAEHYGRGAKKYEDRNWEKGYKWSLSFAALCRHLFAFWDGEDYDSETGGHHLTAVAWHAFALREFQARSLGTDDRARRFEPLQEDATPNRESPQYCFDCSTVHDIPSECWADFPTAEPPSVGAVDAVGGTTCAFCGRAACAGGCRLFCLVCGYARGWAHDRHGCGNFQ